MDMDNKLVKKYCDTLDSKYLERLSQSSKVLFKKLSEVALRVKKSNKKVAKNVIQKLGRKITRIGSREKAEFSLRTMSIGTTGARKGDILLGTHAGTKNVVIKVLNNDIPPSQGILDRMRPFPDIWQKFLIKLGGVDYFSNMSITGREIWLEMNENNNDFFNEEDRIQLIQPGTGDFEKKQGSIFVAYLPNEIIDEMMSNQELSPSYINNTIVEYTGKTSTLVLLKSFWRISTSYKLVEQFDGLVIDVEKGKLLEDKKGKGKDIIVVSNIASEYEKERKNWEVKDTQSVGFRVSSERTKLKKLKTDNELFETSTKNFTAAAYKSLLQKLIRFTPVNVDMGNERLVSGFDLLEWTILKLMKHPGAFVPNIQRFVSGLESSAKRLAVSIYEDSSLHPERYWQLFSLLSGALLAQRVKEWSPSKELIQTWLDVAKYAYESQVGNIVDYKSKVGVEPYILDHGQNILESCSAVLDELRSFPTDLGLARGWVEHIQQHTAKYRPEVMPYYHCIDQHWLPAIAYYFDIDIVESTRKDIKTSSQPFAPLFWKIFFEVTGVNPRHIRTKYSPDFEQKPFVKATRSAQKLILTTLQKRQKKRSDTGETYTLEYEIPDSWLSGLVGVMRISVKGARTIVTLKTDNPLEFVVTREPLARRGKTSYKPLTAQQEEDAIIIAKHRLRQGKLLDQATVPDDSLIDAKVYLMDDNEDESYYAIGYSGEDETVPWDIAKHITITLPIHQPIKRTMKKALLNIGNGVEKDFYNKIDDLLENIPRHILQRILIYISTANSEFEMNRISREGGSTTNMSVNIDDVWAYQLLLKISTIIPGGLRPNIGKPASFIVPNGPLLWTVREHLQKKFYGQISKKDIEGWNQMRFKDTKRVPYEYQQTALQDMIDNHNRGMRGNFLWLALGSGKTFLILNYLRWLKKNKQLPKYVIYTLPPESAMSIIQEIEYFDIKTNMMIPLKNIGKKKEPYIKAGITVTQGCEPKPYHINLIFHDHLKNCRDELPLYASESVIIFDEVHLFLNQTLRTGMGMNLSRLAREFVSLTGTPIVDNKTEKLIGWLEQIVPFEVNKQNFWTAANNMIAKEITTGIKTETSNVIAPLNEKEQYDYQKLVPPALGGSNTNPHSRDWIRASDICYKACDRMFVKLTVKMLKKERGVMIVVRNTAHQQRMYKLLLKNTELTEDDIFLIEKDKSIFLTDETVESGKTPDYKVVIVPKNKSQGYTLTRLSVMLTSVYPSNSATRDQLRGRINRIGQKVEPVLYKIVHIGVLTSILENHDKAKNLLHALQAIAKQV